MKQTNTHRNLLLLALVVLVFIATCFGLKDAIRDGQETRHKQEQQNR